MENIFCQTQFWLCGAKCEMRVSCGVKPIPPGAVRPFLRLAKYAFHSLSNTLSLVRKVLIFTLFLLASTNFTKIWKQKQCCWIFSGKCGYLILWSLLVSCRKRFWRSWTNSSYWCWGNAVYSGNGLSQKIGGRGFSWVVPLLIWGISNWQNHLDQRWYVLIYFGNSGIFYIEKFRQFWLFRI